MPRTFGPQSKGRTYWGQILRSPIRSQSGQLVVEYILLLIIAVGVAIVLTSSLVSRSESDPGFMIVKWRQIIDVISKDKADDLKTEEP